MAKRHLEILQRDRYCQRSTAGTKKKAFMLVQETSCLFGFRRLLEICIIIKSVELFLCNTSLYCNFAIVYLLNMWYNCSYLYICILILFFSHDPIGTVLLLYHSWINKYRKSYEREWISWYLGTNDVFKFLKIAGAPGECNLRNLKISRVTIYHEMHEGSYDFLFVIFSTKL